MKHHGYESEQGGRDSVREKGRMWGGAEGIITASSPMQVDDSPGCRPSAGGGLAGGGRHGDFNI